MEGVKGDKGRRVLWQDSESLVFLSKEREDFHIDPSDEVTVLSSAACRISSTIDGEGKQRTAVEAGRILCPGGVPHSPRVEEDSWFIVLRTQAQSR